MSLGGRTGTHLRVLVDGREEEFAVQHQRYEVMTAAISMRSRPGNGSSRLTICRVARFASRHLARSMRRREMRGIVARSHI